MKTYRSYLIRGLNILLVMLLIVGFYELHKSISYERRKKEKNETIVYVTESILPSTPRVVKVAKAKVKEKTNVISNVSNVDTTNSEVLAVYHGNISYYTPDCVGCIGITASGYDVRNNTYYNDETYGTVRIVAGDRSIPFGTIIRINSGETHQLAIVLDRGGAIGFQGKYLFDVLCQNVSQAYQYGVINNAQVDVLRYGF